MHYTGVFQYTLHLLFTLYCKLFGYLGTAVVVSSTLERHKESFPNHHFGSVIIVPDTALCNIAKYGVAFIAKFSQETGFPKDVKRYRDFLMSILHKLRLSKKEWENLLLSENIIVLPVRTNGVMATNSEMKQLVEKHYPEIVKDVRDIISISKTGKSVSLGSSDSINNGFICNGISETSIMMSEPTEGHKRFSRRFITTIFTYMEQGTKFLNGSGEYKTAEEGQEKLFSLYKFSIVNKILD